MSVHVCAQTQTSLAYWREGRGDEGKAGEGRKPKTRHPKTGLKSKVPDYKGGVLQLWERVKMTMLSPV